MLTCGFKKIHIGVDPFGNIDYTHWENRTEKLNYTNKMKQLMIINLQKYCYDNEFEFIFFPLEDTEFFKRYSDGIPIYNQNKYIINTYSLVFFDGPHSVSAIKTEFDFFHGKIPKGGYVVFDDINQYPHVKALHPYILSKGYQTQEYGRTKISYKYIGTN